MLQHVTLEVRPDQVRDCVAFWELLGFTELEPPPILRDRFTWIGKDDTHIHLVPLDTPAVPTEGHTAVTSDDAEATVATLREARLRPAAGQQRMGRAALVRARSGRPSRGGHVRPAAVEPRVRIKPPALRDGATIASSRRRARRRSRSEIEQATAYFERRGYDLVFGPNHRRVHGYLAGTDEQRAADVQWALSEPGIDMVLCLEGGYGAARLYRLIDWDALGDPRIFCGYSDITALHLALAKHGRLDHVLRPDVHCASRARRTS